MSRPKPNKAQVKRFQRLQEMGCIACKLDWVVDVPPDIHHLTEGYRLGHDYTIPLCPYHHRGVRDGSPCSIWRRPTLAEDKKAFVERYGTERELLDIVNQWLSTGIFPQAARETVRTSFGVTP